MGCCVLMVNRISYERRKYILCLLRLVVKSTVTVVVVYYRFMFKVASICFSRFSDSHDQGLCNRVKHCVVIYAFWNAENLCPSAVLTACAYTIDFMCHCTQ